MEQNENCVLLIIPIQIASGVAVRCEHWAHQRMCKDGWSELNENSFWSLQLSTCHGKRENGWCVVCKRIAFKRSDIQRSYSIRLHCLSSLVLVRISFWMSSIIVLLGILRSDYTAQLHSVITLPRANVIYILCFLSSSLLQDLLIRSYFIYFPLKAKIKLVDVAVNDIWNYRYFS